MSHDPHHEHILKELTDQLEPVFSNSPQAIYLYLDDTHKSCNKKFAEMLGYKSEKQWVENEFPVEDITEEDRKRGIKAYMEASEKYKASALPATWIRKDGKKINTTVIMVPITYKEEVFVLHFISETTK